MKLSKKGFKKIISTCKFDDAIATYTLNFSSPDKDYCFEVQGTSFKSDDFEDCVMLTVEEAKTFLNITKVLKFCAQISKNKHFGHLKNLEKVLTDRIERALIAKICEDFNEDLNKALAEFQKQAEVCNERT